MELTSILKNKKGQLGSLQSIVMALVMIGILLGIGFLILEEFMDQMDDSSEAEDGVNQTIQALKELPDWLDVVVIVSIAGVLLAIVFMVLPRAGGRV